MATSRHASGDCPTATVLIAFATGKLSGEEGERILVHLQWCAACQEEVKDLRQFLAGDVVEDFVDRSKALDLKQIDVPQRLARDLFPPAPSNSARAPGPEGPEQLLRAARLALDSGEYQDAHHRAERALAQSQEIGDKPMAGAALGILGDVSRNLSRLDQAITYYDQALAIAREIGDRLSEGKWLGGLGNTYARRGDAAKALSCHQAALAIAQDTGERQAEGDALAHLGTAHWYQGEFGQAIEYYQQALVIAREVHDRRGEGICLGNLGMVSGNIGNFSEAITYYEQALAIAEELKDPQGMERRLGNLATAYHHLGNFSQAIKYYEQALALACSIGDKRDEGIWLSNLGAVWHGLGDTDRALSHHRQALQIAKEIGDRRGEGRAMGNLGNVYSEDLKRFEEAIGCYTQAIQISRTLRNRANEGLWLGALGITNEEIGNLPEAISHFRWALAAAEEVEDRLNEGIWSGHLGNALRKTGDLSSAIAQLQRAARILAQIGAADHGRRVLTWLGLAYSDCNAHEEARNAFESAASLMESIRGSLFESRHRSRVLSRGLHTYQGLVATCVTLRRYAEAFEYVERARSDRLVELLSNRELRPKGPVPRVLAEEFENSRANLKRLHPALRHWQETKPDHPIAQRLREEAQLATRRFDQVATRIKALDPDFAASIKVESIRYRDVQQCVPDDETAIVELFATESRLLAFVILKSWDCPAVVSLPELSPSEAVGIANTWLQNYGEFRANPAAGWQPWRETMDFVLATLYRKFFAPVKPLLDDHHIRKLIFIPHHGLHLIPLHALFADQDEPRRYLIDIYDEISYAPSAAALRRCRERHRPLPQRLLIICNPDHPREYGRPLAHAEREAASIAAKYPGARIQKDSEATPEVVLHEGRESHLLHLICHGVFDLNQPLQSYLGLSGNRLTLGEIFERLELPETSLAVLSACETGMVEISQIDDYVGLPSGFLAAGVPAVISSLWMVDDEATSLLMGKVYENLLVGMGKARALNEAQRWLSSLGGEALFSKTARAESRFAPTSGLLRVNYAHPFYWGAFCLSGVP